MNSDSVFQPRAIVVRSPDQVSGDLEGKVVLLSILNGEYYNLNEVGSRIWVFLEKSMAIGGLIEQWMAEFEVDRETCERDSLAFLARLRADKLLQVTPSAARSWPRCRRRRRGWAPDGVA